MNPAIYYSKWETYWAPSDDNSHIIHKKNIAQSVGDSMGWYCRKGVSEAFLLQ